MRYDSSTNRIYVRQSWLGTYLICPQRSRYDMVMPKLRRGSDATAIGTGVHSAIEGYLRGEYDDLKSMLGRANDEVSSQMEDPTLRRTDISKDVDHMMACVDSMVVAWWDTIRPEVTLDGKVEHKFSAPLAVHANGAEVWLEGTIDYVAPDGTLWDWKTAGRSYSAKEKQKQSHQATCYVAACRTLGLVPDTEVPTPFRFGVMLRQHTPKAQIVTVERGPEQVEWLRRQVLSVANTALTVSTDVDWAINDQHNLCSSKWCDYWTVCKGVHWSDSAMEPPSQ